MPDMVKAKNFADKVADYMKSSTYFDSWSSEEVVKETILLLTNDIGCAQEFLRVLGVDFDLYEPNIPRCSVCKARLQPVFGHTTNQFEDALHVSFDGGYGEYIDNTSPDEEEEKKLVICKICADELCAKIPWINTLLKE